MFAALALVNSKYGSEFADLLNPTHHFKAGDFARLPLPKVDGERIGQLALQAIEIAHLDLDLAGDRAWLCFAIG